MCKINILYSDITDVLIDSTTGAVSIVGLYLDKQVPICYEGTRGNWSLAEASVTCRHLGYLEGEPVVVTEDDVEDIPQVVVLDFQCNGGMLFWFGCLLFFL